MAKAGAEPINMMRTSVEIPVFPLEHRCHICRLCHTHGEFFDQLTARLLEARPRKQIIAWAKKQGVVLCEKALSRHYQRHMLPYFREALEVERRLKAEHSAIGGGGHAIIASVLARTLAMRGLTAATLLNMEAVARSKNPDRVIKALTELALAIARIDSLAADTELKQKLVQLRAIELDLKAGKLDQVAARWIMLQLEGKPQIARQVLALLALPVPMPEQKALPAPHEKNDRTKTRRPVREIARKGR